MRKLNSQADSRNLGWLLAGVLTLVSSSSAWALDFDREIARQERMTVKVLTAEELRKARAEKADSVDPESNLSVTLVKADTLAKNR